MEKEDITSRILMPELVRKAWDAALKMDLGREFLTACEKYKKELDNLAFKEYRIPSFYYEFREFLSRHEDLFQQDLPILEKITDEQIDYVLERVKEERNLYAAAAEKLVKS